MRLPVIRSLSEYIEEKPENGRAVVDAVEVLEHLSLARGIKDEELDVIGELISNMCGAVEVSQMVKSGTDKKEALNTFMQRVLSSIDK